MEITAQNVNQVARRVGVTLVQAGLKMIASAFKLNPQEVSYNEMTNLVANKLGCQAGFMDGKFFLVDIQTWKDFIATDWIETKKYISDKFDCDNFAKCFAGHASEIFDITVGDCYGTVYNKDTGKKIDLHYWNVIVTKELDGLHLWFYEPMNDGLTEVIDKSKIIIGNMRYEPIKVTLY